MLVTIAEDGGDVVILDQTRLPRETAFVRLRSLADTAHAIRVMQVRGAPLIGATAAFGVALGLREGLTLERSIDTLAATRPTAVNLHWALERMRGVLEKSAQAVRQEVAWTEARAIAREDAAANAAIGRHGLAVLEPVAARKGRVEVMTHCNAGWLATVDWGTALAPIYLAHEAGKTEGFDLHVWASETRPRNQGASLTAWELNAHGVPHTVIADNAAGHLMTHGRVDMIIVGADRVAANGDVANKIGTYLKALAARDNGVPFYVAVPGPTIDWRLDSGAGIPIEERSPEEVTHLPGLLDMGEVAVVQLTPDGSSAANPAFDVTPARLVTGLITERGVCAASREGMLTLYPEHK